MIYNNTQQNMVLNQKQQEIANKIGEVLDEGREDGLDTTDTLTIVGMVLSILCASDEVSQEREVRMHLQATIGDDHVEVLVSGGKDAPNAKVH